MAKDIGLKKSILKIQFPYNPKHISSPRLAIRSCGIWWRRFIFLFIAIVLFFFLTFLQYLYKCVCITVQVVEIKLLAVKAVENFFLISVLFGEKSFFCQFMAIKGCFVFLKFSNNFFFLLFPGEFA